MKAKLDQARALKRLFERQRDKVGHLPPDERDEAASKLMDDLVGPEWSVVIKLPAPLTMLTPATEGPAEGRDSHESSLAGPGDPEALMCRVRKALSEAGESPEEYPEPEATRQSGGSDDLRTRAAKLIKELLG